MTKNRQKPHTSKLTSKYILYGLLSIYVLLGIAYGIRQRIYDEARLYNYRPPASISALATADTMTAYTKHVFYVNHPILLPSVASFRADCPEDEADIVIGCYHVGQAGIYIYNVQDSSLAGVQEVTAAHEVLHAIYARLSPSARNRLDSQLEAFYKHGLNNPTVEAEVKVYIQTEPGDVDDEMSCTFGTELAQLPANLSAYYRQFFSNRSAIVAYEQKYQATFTSKQKIIASDDSELTSLKQQITVQELALAKQHQQIELTRLQLQSMQSTNPTAYNAAVPGFNSDVTSYNTALNSVQNDIASYNQLVTSRNSVAGAFDTLVSAIDTRQSPEQD